MSDSDKQIVAALETDNTARIVALFTAGIDILTPYVVIYKDGKEFLLLEDGREIEVVKEGLAISFVSAAIPTQMNDVIAHHPIHDQINKYGHADDSNRNVIIDEAEIQLRAQQLIRDAARSGVILTIELVPEKPLAMGNYTMVARTRRRDYRNG